MLAFEVNFNASQHVFFEHCMNKLQVFKVLIKGVPKIDFKLTYLKGVNFRREYVGIGFETSS